MQITSPCLIDTFKDEYHLNEQQSAGPEQSQQNAEPDIQDADFEEVK